MAIITERGRWANSTVDERGRKVFSNGLTERGQKVFGLTGGGTTLRVSLSDTVILSEILTKSPSKMFSDSLTLAETFFKQGNLSKSDSISASDSIYKNPSKLLSDSINTSDSLSKNLTVTVVDTISTGDSSTSSQGGKSASLSDTVIVTDAIVKKVISTYKNDAVNLSDVDNHTATKQLLDSIISSDTITVSNGKSIILSDTITVTDAIFKAVNVLRSDSITLADSTSKTAKIGVYDLVITTDELNLFNPNAPQLIGTIQLKGSRILNVYLVGNQILNVNLKGVID
jgi:hypothetical protein